MFPLWSWGCLGAGAFLLRLELLSPLAQKSKEARRRVALAPESIPEKHRKVISVVLEAAASLGDSQRFPPF